MVIAYRLHYGIVANCPSNFIPNGLPNISKMGHRISEMCMWEIFATIEIWRHAENRASRSSASIKIPATRKIIQ